MKAPPTYEEATSGDAVAQRNSMVFTEVVYVPRDESDEGLPPPYVSNVAPSRNNTQEAINIDDIEIDEETDKEPAWQDRMQAHNSWSIQR